jgi:hypothetical protein
LSSVFANIFQKNFRSSLFIKNAVQKEIASPFLILFLSDFVPILVLKGKKPRFLAEIFVIIFQKNLKITLAI